MYAIVTSYFDPKFSLHTHTQSLPALAKTFAFSEITVTLSFTWSSRNRPEVRLTTTISSLAGFHLRELRQTPRAKGVYKEQFKQTTKYNKSLKHGSTITKSVIVQSLRNICTRVLNQGFCGNVLVWLFYNTSSLLP